MIILCAADIRVALSMKEAINAVRAGFIALSTGQAAVPIRRVMSVADGTLLYMPAYIEGEPVSVVKVVSVYPKNSERNLATVIGSVLVLDASTGVPMALLDGTALTALRTGAASGLATDLLANPEASILGVIGAGVQARSQIAAVCAVRNIRQIRVFSQSGKSAQILAAQLGNSYQAEIQVANSGHEAIAHADIIVTATTSQTPVVYAADVTPGVHINGIGSFTPQMQEVATDIVTRAKVVVDHRQSVWEEAGDLIIPRNQGQFREENVHAELGEVAAGLVPGRESPREITFFKSVGNAVQDAAVAGRVVALAMERGLGTTVET